MPPLIPAQPIEIRISTIDPVKKLDAIGAVLAAVREAHRDEISPRAWAELNRAQEAIAAAMLTLKEGRLLG